MQIINNEYYKCVGEHRTWVFSVIEKNPEYFGYTVNGYFIYNKYHYDTYHKVKHFNLTQSDNITVISIDEYMLYLPPNDIEKIIYNRQKRIKYLLNNVN